MEFPGRTRPKKKPRCRRVRGESLVAQLDSTVTRPNNSEISKFSSSTAISWASTSKKRLSKSTGCNPALAASLTSEQAQLQAIQQRAPGWTAGKKAHAQWEQQVARRKTRIAQIALRLERVGEIEEAAGVYAERKIEELAEHKLRFDKPELTLEWDKIQHRERQASIPAIESTQSVGQDLGRSLTLSRVVDEE